MNHGENSERREQSRFPLKGNILVDGKITFQCIDISEGGMYLYTGRSFEENRIVTVTLPIKGKPLTVKAQIKHNEPGIGIGLQFIELTDEQAKTIQKLIQHLQGQSIQPIDIKKKILIVEDNEISRQIYKNNLLLEGFSVFESGDGVEALRILKENIPDLILLDLYMEKMDGYTVLSLLKNNPDWEKIPVIVFSATDASEVREKVLKAGADEFLIKMTTTPSRLANTIRTVLQKRFQTI
jgi:CheY-like chemotaxis protein